MLMLNTAEFSIPDGIGLAQAAKFMSLPSHTKNPLRLVLLFLQGLMVGLASFFAKDWLQSEISIIPGRVLFEDLISVANRKGWRGFLLGGYLDSAKKACEKLEKNYLKAEFEYSSGAILGSQGVPLNKQEEKNDQEAVDKINKFKPDILFVGFGAPKQEKWIDARITKLDIGCAMVVGRTFDWYSGASKVAPKTLSNIGLEWLWRLFTGSSTPKRILTAFPLFPLRVFWDKIKR